MKSKNIFSLVIKIMGLIALWKTVMALGILFSGFGMLSFILSGNGAMMSLMMFATFMTILLSFLLPLIVSWLCLFRTDQLIKLLKLDDDSTLPEYTDSKMIYHVLVIVLGVLLLMNGAGDFITYDYKTDSKTEMINNVVNVTKSTNIHANYFALIEIAAGFLLLLRAEKISSRLYEKINS